MYVLCLHADKAKGLQINLSEALQGKKNHKAYISLVLLILMVVVFCRYCAFSHSLTHSDQGLESKNITAINSPDV